MPKGGKAMIIINGYNFYEEPTSCGTCPFLVDPEKNMPSFMPKSGSSGTKHCIKWDEWHHSWANPPRRCTKLFKKAFTYPEGTELVITKSKP